MSADGVHVELTVEGIGRQAFAHLASWIWQRVDFLFPVITGQWTLMEAVIPSGILAGLAMLFRLIVHLADGGRVAQLPRAMIAAADDPNLTTWRSHNLFAGMRPTRSGSGLYRPALAFEQHQRPPAPPRERIEVLDGFAMLAHELFAFLSRFYVQYLGLSVLICWIFGLGDLQIAIAMLGTGGGS